MAIYLDDLLEERNREVWRITTKIEPTDKNETLTIIVLGAYKVIELERSKMYIPSITINIVVTNKDKEKVSSSGSIVYAGAESIRASEIECINYLQEMFLNISSFSSLQEVT